MYKFKALLLLFVLPLFVNAQDDIPDNIDDIITWHFSVEYTGKDEATIVMKVDQKDGWHIYAQVQPDGAIPMGTEFTYQPSADYALIGKTKEYGAELVDKGDGFPEKSFHGSKAKFKQKIKIKSKKDFKLTLDYGYMACKQACLPPELRTEVLNIKGTDNITAGETTEETPETTQDDEGDEGDDEGDHGDEEIEEIGLDSAIYALNGVCEGFEYYENFQPVKVISKTPVQKTFDSYELSVEIKIDSIFKMYDFENKGKLRSMFKLDEDPNIELVGDAVYSLKSKNNLFSKPDSTDFTLVYTQDIRLKDTSLVDTLTGIMDIYIQSCDINFKNSTPAEIQFDLTHPIYLNQDEDDSSLWVVFFLAFASGFIALLTPCVFPMIPMTVTFFTKQSKTKSEGIRKAFMYVIFIIVIYVLLGVLISGIFGAGALNAMATNPWVNLSFAILFVIFAISFLGAFEITLPASWVNKADKQADRGGMIGIFFMAFTLALVSFSCTGPIVGSVLVKSAEGGEVLAPIIAMLGFSSALALPFGLFAAFPGWLNSLPQSGGWLNTVKVTLGFLEIAFAMKFLLQADQGFQTYMFMREIFIAIWIGTFLVLGVYLLGFIQFPHDSKMEKLSVGRGLLGLVCISFVFYLLPGMWGAPVNIISGLAPSKTYSESPYGVNKDRPKKNEGMPETAEYHGHGIWVIKDYDDALAYAKEVDKPLLIDFTGIQCVNCRKMEDFVWAAEEVSPIMADEFVIASLFVDDKKALPESEWITLDDGTVIKEVGKKWFNFQTSKYAQGTQPLYVVVDHEENNISGKASYDTHSAVEDFKGWLENAKAQFEISKNPNISTPDYEIVQ
jgi:thiol:disulfide interchange protein DsbD